MAVTEQQRHQLLTWFEERMDEERAATMMELLPPAGSDQLATKDDVAEIGRRLGARFDTQDSRFDAQDAGMDAKLETLRSSMLRTFGTWLFASQAAVIAALGLLLGLTQ